MHGILKPAFLTNWEVDPVFFSSFEIKCFLVRNGFVGSSRLLSSFSAELKINCSMLSVKTCFDCVHMLMNSLYIICLLDWKHSVYLV